MKKLIAAILCFMLPFAQADTAAIIAKAETHLGKPYHYGAKDQRYDETYEKIEEIENLIPGDLVCFNTKREDKELSDHVGIY